MIGPDATARLLRLREARLGRARRDLARASGALRRSERQGRADEVLLETLERDRDRRSASAYGQMMDSPRTSLSLERFRRELERTREDCEAAAGRAALSAERLSAGQAACRKAEDAVRRASAERETWASLHDRADRERLRAEARRADDEDEALAELRTAPPP